MKTFRLTLAAGALCLSSSLAMAQVVSVATNPQGSLGYATGIAVAKVVTEKSPLTARTQPLGGSTTYIPMINRGEVGLGFSNAVEAQYAYLGTGTFAGKPNPNLRMIGTMFPLRTGMMVAADSPIKTVHDLKNNKGLRITSKYTSLSIIQDYLEAILANGGVSYDDFKKVPVSGFAKGMLALGQDKTDLTLISLGSGAGRQVETQLRGRGGIRYVDMDPSPAATKRFNDVLPSAHIVVESNTKMPGISGPTHIVEIDYMAVTSKDMDAEQVYQIVKALASNKSALAKSLGAFNRLNVQKMAMKQAMPYHPGAIKAYKELGIPVGQ